MSPEALRSNEYLQHTPDVLVLGKNIGIGSSPDKIRNDNFNLSAETRSNVLAAGMLYKPGMNILFSTGQTVGANTPSEAQAMKNYFHAHFTGIPEKHILLEENSIDTASNAEEVAKIVRDKNYNHVGLVTVGYHLHNAVTLFERHGVSVEQKIIAEDIVRERTPHHQRYIENWKETTRIKQEEKKESIRKAFLAIDQKGKLLRLITQRTRK